MKIAEILEMRMHTGSAVNKHFPDIRPEEVSKLDSKNGLYIGLFNDQTTPMKITIWNKNPRLIKEFIVNSIGPQKHLVGYATLMKAGGKFWNVAGPLLRNDYRGKGHGILFYEYALNELYLRLESHTTHSPGSAMIWATLAKNPKYKVVGVDLETDEEIPLTVDGMRLFYGDVTVYDSVKINALRCYRR